MELAYRYNTPRLPLTMNYLYRAIYPYILERKQELKTCLSVLSTISRRVDKWTSINKWLRVVDDCALLQFFPFDPLVRGIVISFRSNDG